MWAVTYNGYAGGFLQIQTHFKISFGGVATTLILIAYLKTYGGNVPLEEIREKNSTRFATTYLHIIESLSFADL